MATITGFVGQDINLFFQPLEKIESVIQIKSKLLITAEVISAPSIINNTELFSCMNIKSKLSTTIGFSKLNVVTKETSGMGENLTREVVQYWG